MAHKMTDTRTDLDKKYDYEMLNKKPKALHKHRFLDSDVDNNTAKGKKCQRYCLPSIGLLTITFTLYLILCIPRNKGIQMSAVGVIHVPTYNPVTLVRIPTELANKSGAFCLDGTVPSYYFRKGKGRGQRSWMLHLQGGGWCWDLPDCYNRSYSHYGSSLAQYLPTHRVLQGILSDCPHMNPDFHDWNVAHVNYCDGAAFSGNVPNPVEHKNQTLYFRGALVLDLVFNFLVQSGGMGDADRIILTGSSAGASAVVLHIDHIKTLLPDGIPLHGLVDAGLFLDTKNMTNFNYFRMRTQNVYNIQQVWGSLNEACVKDQPQDKRWKCFFSVYAYKYVQSPVFYMHTGYDIWQLRHILEMLCHPTECPEQISFMMDFHKKFINFAKEVQNQSKKNGMFISSCPDHSQAYFDDPYQSYIVDGKTPQQAFGDWYFERIPEGSSFYFDCEDSYDCNPTCDWSLEFYKNITYHHLRSVESNETCSVTSRL
ncbi:uncharacterized protein [Amphiura filiformis]|uniref:uncharacterized protein n=1 Tax=Amphiura filiformis TaxID=82378 RepID=UPI003B21B57D